jgi:hypothetical protein
MSEIKLPKTHRIFLSSVGSFNANSFGTPPGYISGKVCDEPEDEGRKEHRQHQGPWTVDGNGPMEPQGLTITQNGSRFITQATLRPGNPGKGDVFVFSLEDTQRYAQRKQIIDGLQP